MSRPIKSARQAAEARSWVPNASIRYQRHAHGVARRSLDARLAASKADLDYLEQIMEATERSAFDRDTWAPIEHHDGRHGA